MNEQFAQRAPIPHPPPQGNVPPTRAHAGGQVRPAHPAGGKTRPARRDGDNRHARGVGTAAGGARIHGSWASTGAAERTKGQRGGTTKLTKHTKKGRHIKVKNTRGGQALTLTAIWQARLERVASSASWHERMVNGRAAASGEKRIDSSRLLAELHHSRAARIRVAGGGARGDAPDAQASALGLPCGQPQPPKRLSPSWDTTNHGGVQ